MQARTIIIQIIIKLIIIIYWNWIFVEILFSMFYFVLFRFLLIERLSFVNELSLFIEITLMHLVSEIFQSILQFSTFYFLNIRGKIKNMLKNRNIIVTHSLIKDESNIQEWKTRHCIDIGIRIIILFVTNCITMFHIFSFGYKYYGLSQNQFLNGLWYNFVSLLIDIIYFATVGCINYYCYCDCNTNDQFKPNVLTPILTLYQSDKKLFINVFALAFLFLNFVW